MLKEMHEASCNSNHAHQQLILVKETTTYRVGGSLYHVFKDDETVEDPEELYKAFNKQKKFH